MRRLALALTLAGIAGLMFDSWHHIHGGSLVDARGDSIGRDFGNAWSGAKLAAMGKPSSAYDLDAYQAFQREFIDPKIGPKWYAYPPIALLLSLPLALFGFLPGYLLWQLGGSLLCAWMVARLVGWKWGALSILAPPAAFLNAWTGQNGCYTAALFAGGIMLLAAQPVVAGILFGLLAFKPQFLILVPVALIAGRQWRALISMSATILVLTAITFVLFGAETWAAFQRISSMNVTILQTKPINWHLMPTVYVMMRSIGVGSAMGYCVQIMAALASLCFTVKVWRGNPPLLLKGCVLIFATFLSTPYAWDYDLVVVTFALIFAFKAIGAETLSEFERLAGVVLIFSPLLTLIVYTGLGVQVAPLLFLTTLVLVQKRASAGAIARRTHAFKQADLMFDREP